MDESLSGARRDGHSSTASRDTANRIQKVLVESLHASADEPGVPYEQRLDEVASVDSIAVLEFMTAVEREFGITIESEFLDFDFLRDLPRLASYLEARMGKPPRLDAAAGERS
jgi:acyl carrier protein